MKKVTTYQWLKSMAYMGHIVRGINGKKLSWQTLQNMSGTVTVVIEGGFNKTYNIVG